MLTPTFNANNSPSSTDYSLDLNDIKIYPNPFQDFIIIESSVDFHITNAIGQTIYISKNNNAHINTKEWENGLYILHSPELNNTVKLIKMK